MSLLNGNTMEGNLFLWNPTSAPGLVEPNAVIGNRCRYPSDQENINPQWRGNFSHGFPPKGTRIVPPVQSLLGIFDNRLGAFISASMMQSMQCVVQRCNGQNGYH